MAFVDGPFSEERFCDNTDSKIATSIEYIGVKLFFSSTIAKTSECTTYYEHSSPRAPPGPPFIRNWTLPGNLQNYAAPYWYSRESRGESSEHVAGINKGSRLRPRSEKIALQVVGEPLFSAVANQYFYFFDNI